MRDDVAALPQSPPLPTVSAFRSALEFAAEPSRLAADTPRRVPLLAGLNPGDASGIAREIEAAIAAGFGTLKVKVGLEARAYAARVRLIQRINAGRLRLRLDGNQGLARDEACRFAAGLDPESIERLEQPCEAADWDAAIAVAKIAAVPMMLDNPMTAIPRALPASLRETILWRNAATLYGIDPAPAAAQAAE
jgi:L-alanine-DL-glutamate epimerase-like enolase superfamily enzyme